MPIAMLVFGPLADVIPIEYMLIITGVILSIQSLYMIKSRTMILAGLPKEKEGERQNEQFLFFISPCCKCRSGK